MVIDSTAIPHPLMYCAGLESVGRKRPLIRSRLTMNSFLNTRIKAQQTGSPFAATRKAPQSTVALFELNRG